MLPRYLRLRRPQDFRAVQRDGQRWSGEHLVLSKLPNGRDHNRYGFVVSKQVGNAVTRNLVKRRLRALVSSSLTYHPPGLDIVLIARKSSASASYEGLGKDFSSLENRADIARQLL